MYSDSKLFKEAIADAKAVRQTALANAKVALEEAFSERYRSMFAEKLKEDAGMAPAATSEEEGMKPEENVSEKEVDELIKELEAEVGGGNEVAPEAPAGDEVAPEAPAGDEVAPVAPGAEMGAGAPAPIPPLVPPSTPGAGCIPPPTTAGAPPMPIAPEVPPMGAGAGAEGGMPQSEVPQTGEPEEDENVDLDELLESLKEEVEEGYEEEEEEEGKNMNEGTKLTSSGIGGGKAGGSANKQPASGARSSSKIESGGMKQEGVPSVDSTKVGPEDASKAARPNQATHATKENLSTPSMGGGDKGGGNGGKGIKGSGIPSVDSTKENNPDTVTRPNQAKNATKDNLSTPGGALEENIELKKQLDEATETIKYVKGQLNEINLLNAKLLYTNKLFKEYNMTNEHKMRIVEMFDLAKTVREVKLTYANLAESLNFGGVDQRKKVAVTNSSVQSITEGLASKAVGSTKPKAIITEGKFAARMKQLAGIRSEPKK